MCAKAFSGFFQFHNDEDFLFFCSTFSLKFPEFGFDFGSVKRVLSADLDRRSYGKIKDFGGGLCKYRALLIASISCNNRLLLEFRSLLSFSKSILDKLISSSNTAQHLIQNRNQNSVCTFLAIQLFQTSPQTHLDRTNKHHKIKIKNQHSSN